MTLSGLLLTANLVFPYLQEHDALSFIFMQNVGVLFGKVINLHNLLLWDLYL